MATGNAAQNTVVVSNPRGIRVGMSVSGVGIGYGAQVAEFIGNTVILSVNNDSIVSGSLLIDAVTTTASGLLGQKVINVTDPTGIVVGMSVSGTGIDTGTSVVSLSGAFITLSKATNDSVSGALVFRAAPSALRTLIKAWTLSNAACNAAPTICSGLQNVNTAFTADLSANRQAMNAVSCVPIPSMASAYETLFFGITSSNRDIGSYPNNNVALRHLYMNTGNVLP